MNDGYFYILTNYNRTTLYCGVTNNIKRRVFEHRTGQGGVFTKKYKLTVLAYYEHHDTIVDAIDREKQVKNWHREWKLNLIKSINPEMNDLALSELGFDEKNFNVLSDQDPEINSG